MNFFLSFHLLLVSGFHGKSQDRLPKQGKFARADRNTSETRFRSSREHTIKQSKSGYYFTHELHSMDRRFDETLQIGNE